MRKKTGTRRVAALMAAGMLAVLPAMSAAAEEPVKITSIEDADNIMAAYDDEDTEWEEIYLDSAEDMEKFSCNCRLDTWSVNKKVYLTKDIDLSDSTFVSIPAFGGYFDGQGHTVSGLVIRDPLSYTGLFSRTQQSAVIANLKVKGSVRPSGKAMVTGGIVGDNSGIIINCGFEGIVEGSDYVGGITGFNGQSGILIDCTAGGTGRGTHYTGGIAGENTGNIAGCVNEADVNVSNEDKGRSLEDINLEQYASGLLEQENGDGKAEKASVLNNTIDSGGIAGLSTGIIQYCSNSGTIGYEHVGYNTGGIAGRQSGYVYACENEGTVYGRKDVGGIAGQTEPYIAVDLSEDIAYQLSENIDKLHDLTGRMLEDAGAESDTVSARLTVIQDFVDKALDDTGVLADRTIEWTDGMVSSANDLMGRVDYIMDETGKNDGFIDQTGNAAGNMRDAAQELGDTVEALDIYQYMTEEEKARYEEARAGMEAASKQYAEDYAAALEAYRNYYIDKVRSENDNYTRSVSEKDLRPLIQDIVQADWTWESNKSDYRNYIGIDGWVHYSMDAGGAETVTPFPQEDGEQGELDRQLLQDVAEEMAEPVNAVRIEADAERYAEERYMAAHPSSSGYQQDMREYLQTMSSIVLKAGEKMSEETRGRMKTAVGSVEDAMGDLVSAGGEAKSLFDTVNGMPDLQMPQLGSEYRSRAGSLNTNLQGLSENMDQLNQEMSSGNDVMPADLAAINDQFSMIMRLYTDAIDGVLDMDYAAVYEDTSQEDAESSTDATIADCTNRGTVRGDLNVSGITGTMAIEYDFDLEGDVTGIENARLNSTFLTRCVLRDNVNEGSVTAQKSYAGGIAGLQEMGTVLRCENYGRISSTAGSYVGGIAGKSLSHITDGYAKCTVSGETYAAGIAGFGSSMENCCAMVRVQDASSFYGAIAGDVDHSGTVVNNRFVSEEMAGIDRISYSGKAEPVSYEELLAAPGLPARFQMMSVVFYADEEEVKRLQCPYKSDVSAKLYPDIPARDGFYADWDIREIPGILYDEDVTAEYVRYLTTLASAQTRENGQSILLADGMFKQEAELVVADAGNAAEKTALEDVTECWRVTIPEDGKEQHQIRYQAPQGETEDVSVYRKQNDGTWLQLDTELMGIYHLFTVEGTEAEIAVCIQDRKLQAYLVYGIPAVLTAAMIVFFVGKSRKRKKGKVLVSDVAE